MLDKFFIVNTYGSSHKGSSTALFKYIEIESLKYYIYSRIWVLMVKRQYPHISRYQKRVKFG